MFGVDDTVWAGDTILHNKLQQSGVIQNWSVSVTRGIRETLTCFTRESWIWRCLQILLKSVESIAVCYRVTVDESFTTQQAASGTWGTHRARSSHPNTEVHIEHALGELGCCVFDRLEARDQHCPNAQNPSNIMINLLDPLLFEIPQDYRASTHAGLHQPCWRWWPLLVSFD